MQVAGRQVIAWGKEIQSCRNYSVLDNSISASYETKEEKAMKKTAAIPTLFCLLLILFLPCSWTSTSVASAFPGNPPGDTVDKVQVITSYGKLPLSFIENRGQVDQRARFYLKGREGTIYFTKEGIVYDLLKREFNDSIRQHEPGKKVDKPGKVSRFSFTLKFEGALPDVQISANKKLTGTVNYLRGNEPVKWQTGIPLYQEITYHELYRGIDLKVYGTSNQMEYDFIVHPGADPEQIELSAEGTEGLSTDAEGNLLINTPFGPIRHLKPVTYQEINSSRKPVDSSFEIVDKSVTFFANKYDQRYPLVIDPITLSYSTYLGGSSWDLSDSIALDKFKNAYVTGETYSFDFPVSNGFQPYSGGEEDVFVAKISATGDALIYSTFLGGNEYETSRGIAVDAWGNAYATGTTQSSNFPLYNAFQPFLSNVGTDGFVTKINAAGTGLGYSTYLGGNDGDSPYDIAVDNAGDSYVVGFTDSIDFPIYNAIQPNIRGKSDAFVTKISKTGTSLIYSTYLGGTGEEWGMSITLDASRNAYVTGYTDSSNFPVYNAFQPYFAGGVGRDVFVTKINKKGSGLVYSTYLGGDDWDFSSDIAVDASKNVYVAGVTHSRNFPLYNAIQPYFGGNHDGFVTKINPSGSTLVYSTYLGGSGGDVTNGIAVDTSRNIYLAGVTSSSDFPVTSAFQPLISGTMDGFVVKINQAGTAFFYSTYLGGSREDIIYDVALDSSRNVYVTGFTASFDFPVYNAFQSYLSGGEDVFVTKINE